MRIQLLYFGRVAEVAAVSEEYMELMPDSTLDHLNQQLQTRHPGLKTLQYHFAVNETMAKHTIRLKENDCVALLPPFAGG